MRLTRSRQIFIASCLFMILCVLSGRPQLFPDTKGYYALGQETGTMLKIPPPENAGTALRGRELEGQQAVRETRLAYTVAATRSPFYGLYLYVLERIGTAWLVVAVQALLAASLLYIAARSLGSEGFYLPSAVILAFLSSLPIFILFVMPDLFAGTSILGATLLVFCRPMLTRWEHIYVWLLTAAGCLFHTSHVPLVGALGVLALLASLIPVFGRSDLRPGSFEVIAIAIIGVLGSIAYPLGVQALRHEPIYAPPFIAARLLADGPGRKYLREVCRGSEPYGLCVFKDRPLDDSNFILWSKEPDKTVFQSADYDLRVRIIKEQPAFVWNVISNYPGEVAADAWKNVYGQFFQYGTWDVLDDITPSFRMPDFAIFADLVPGTKGCRDGTASCETHLSIRLMDDLIGTTLLVSIAVILLLLATGRVDRRFFVPMILFVLAGFVVNAAVCGLLSGNSQRYQSRVTWLIPMFALYMIGNWRQNAKVGVRI